MKYTLKNKIFDISLIILIGAVTFFTLLNIVAKYVPEVNLFWRPTLLIVSMFGLKEVIGVLKEKDIFIES